MAILFDDAGGEHLKSSSLIASPPITVAAWFRSDDASIDQRVFGLDGGGPQMHACRLDATTRTISALSQSLGSATATTASSWNVDQWHHGLWTFATSRRTATLDGGATAVDTGTQAPTVGDTGIAGPGQPLSGSVAELAVWSADLSVVAEWPSVKHALARGFTPPGVYPADLVAWFRFINAAIHDVIGGFAMTQIGSPAAAAHPRIWNHRASRRVHAPGLSPRVVSLGGVYRRSGVRIVLAG